MNTLEIINLIKRRLGKFEEFDKDNNKLVFGNKKAKIDRIYFCWRLTLDILKELNSDKNTLIICHEPVLFNIKYSLTPEYDNNLINSNKEKLNIIKSSNINIARFHLSLDSSPYGTNATLIEKMNLVEKKHFDYFSICELKNSETAEDFLKKIKKSLKLPFINLTGDKNKRLKKVLIIAGGGANKEFVSFALSNKCDAIVSGDSYMESKYLAYENNMLLIDIGHQNSEVLGVENFAEIIKNDLIGKDIQINFIGNKDIEIIC
ncbi:MAG: Nif3-like dinuclear metal center hexameric protein [Nanoarchaeota archaeon]